MKVFRNLENLPKFDKTVITIGSFDGVHNGHRRIIEKVTQLAKEKSCRSVVITFDPHPRLVLQESKNDSPPLSLLTTTDEKVKLLSQLGVDAVVVVPFSKEFSEQSAEAYISDFLIKYFKPAQIVIGYDHRFGAKRVGDIELLRAYAPQFGYEVIEIAKQEIDEIAVSSSKIRKAFAASNVNLVNRLLGYPFVFTGKVVEGQRIGREIGFPTANLEIKDRHKILPPFGIYAVFVWVDGRKFQGMLYRGDRPVLKEHENVTIEVNIFDFNKDIYGKDLKVELIEFLREDKKFDSLEDLVVQLADDERVSKDILQKIENQVFPKVAVVILNYNTPHFLRQFLPAVCSAQYGNMNIFVADNGSTDDSIQAVQVLNLEGIPNMRGLDRIRVIALPQNYGFAQGYNEALAHEKLTAADEDAAKKAQHFLGSTEGDYDYYALINSDCRVTPNWIQPLVEMMEKDPTIAVAQPKLLSYTKKRKFEYAGAGGGWIDALGYAFSRGRVFDFIEKDRKQYDTAEEIFWATGAAMFVRADIWHKFGGFDGDYFAHWEEIDFCWRVKRAGYKVVVNPKSVVRHVGGGTMSYLSPRKTYLNFRNNFATILKNESLAKLIWLIPVRLILDGVAGAKFLAEGNYKHTWEIVKAHFYIYTHIFSIISKRLKYNEIIEKNRIAPENKEGILRGSVIWRFFVQKKRTFNEIMGIEVKKVVEDTDEDDED